MSKVRAAIETLKSATGVIGKLGDEVFFFVLRDAISGPSQNALTAQSNDLE